MASRWDELADDLVGRATAAKTADRAAQAAEITRADLAEISLPDRLRAATGASVGLEVRGLGRLHGVVTAVGRDGFLVREVVAAGSPGRELLVPYLSLLSISGLGSRAVSDRAVAPVEARLGLGHWLRGCVRDRLRVDVVLVDGTVRAGTLDAIGADHLELAEHAADAPRRRSQVTGHRLVPLHALAAVVRAAGPAG